MSSFDKRRDGVAEGGLLWARGLRSSPLKMIYFERRRDGTAEGGLLCARGLRSSPSEALKMIQNSPQTALRNAR